MLELLPIRAFFRFELPLYFRADTPRPDGDLRKWPRRYLLPPLVELEGKDAIADVYASWNDEGIQVAFDVPNRNGPLVCDPTHWWKKDGLRLCIDTRDARDVKRATRFCHFFYFLPAGGGANKKQPIVGTHRMSHAKEPPPTVDVSLIRVGATVTRTGYSLEVAIPGAALQGWDPSEHPRIGFFYKVKDGALGEQHLSVDDELGWNVDPSTWATAVLTR